MTAPTNPAPDEMEARAEKWLDDAPTEFMGGQWWLSIDQGGVRAALAAEFRSIAEEARRSTLEEARKSTCYMCARPERYGAAHDPDPDNDNSEWIHPKEQLLCLAPWINATLAQPKQLAVTPQEKEE